MDCADETLRPGSRGRVHGPPGFAVDFIVEVLDPVDFIVEVLDPAEQRWSWRARVLLVGVRLHLEHGVHDDTGSECAHGYASAARRGWFWRTHPWPSGR